MNRIEISWRSILTLIGASIAISIGATWQIVSDHKSGIHATSVDIGEFARWTDRIDDRLSRIEDDVDDVHRWAKEEWNRTDR